MKPDVLVVIPTIVILLLIGLIVSLFLNKVKALKRRSLVKWVLIVISTISIYLLSVIIVFGTILKEKRIEFDTSVWKNNEEIRYQMVDDLIENEILIGKNREKVIEVLGNPDTISEDSSQWSFSIGMSKAGLGFKFTTMEITFSEDKVIEIKKIEIFD